MCSLPARRAGVHTILDRLFEATLPHIPRPLAGIPELVACRGAEAKAEELREQMLATLVEQGPAPWQPDTTLVVEMRSAAEMLVTSAARMLYNCFEHFSPGWVPKELREKAGVSPG